MNRKPSETLADFAADIDKERSSCPSFMREYCRGGASSIRAVAPLVKPYEDECERLKSALAFLAREVGVGYSLEDIFAQAEKRGWEL